MQRYFSIVVTEAIHSRWLRWQWSGGGIVHPVIWYPLQKCIVSTAS